MKTLSIQAFTGMNTYTPKVAKGLAVPERIVDALPTPAGDLVVRPGSELVIPLEECSNLWKSKGTGLAYCIGNGSLCRVDLSRRTATPLLAISMPGAPVYFANHGDIDFIGNRFWLMAVENGVVRKWGQTADDLQSLNWQTSDGGLVLFHVNPAGERTVTPHPGEFIHPPNPMDMFAIAHGRMWGCIGKRLVYSSPHAFEWFEDDENHFEFNNNTTMYAPVAGGAFIGTETETIFLSGTNPDEPESMGQVVKQWVGVAKDSYQIAPQIGDELPPDMPTWMNNNGNIVAGLPDGSIMELTREQIENSPHPDCRSGVINLNGSQTLLYKVKE